ncbi:hypothetical protein [Methanosphaera cuniculi]|uniref:hypothetical protein n=1 Tax=Methanosphaera cuniculi TaxID=1077256 RepID=UPI0026F2380E|nr:hypothetical protein [Methanosphaera cuniculi]
MKMISFGIDISDNDISCSEELIIALEDDLYKIEDAGAQFARITNITGDDLVITAVIDDDDKLKEVNQAIFDVLKNNALGFEDLNGVGKTEQEAGEGISYVELNLNKKFYPDAIIVAFDTYCGEAFVDDVAKQAYNAAKGIDGVADIGVSSVKGIKHIPGVGYVSSKTDDPIVVVAVEDIHQVGVIAGAIIGAVLGYRNTYLVKRGTPTNVIPGSVIFTVSAILNSNVMDLAEPFSYIMRLLKK